jgi:uncharacterized membrane protein
MTFAFLTKISRKWVSWVLADILIFLVFTLIAWRYFPAEKQTGFYLDTALRMLHGQIPYVDFGIEYPPLALFFYLLPALFFRSLISYYVAFTVELLLFDLLAMFLIAKIGSRLGMPVNKSLLIHALVIIAVGPIVVASFDIIPAVMVLAALAFLISGRSNIAWAAIGLGIMTKLYPFIIAPIFVLYHLRQKQYKQTAQGAIMLIVVVLALSLPWLLLNVDGFFATFTYHLQRGLHSESSYGSILLVGKIIGVVRVEGIYNFSSWNLDSPLADQLSRVSFFIMAGLLAIVYFLYTRTIYKGTNHQRETIVFKLADTAALVQYVTAAILLLMLSGKVFSMQYLIWLCPLLPLITGRWRVPIYASFLTACIFSQFIYPYYYPHFEHFVPLLVVMMFARNALLLLCAVLILLPREHSLKNGYNTP